MTEPYTYEQRLQFARDGVAMAITECCNELYELFERGYPLFVREEFIDRVRLVRAHLGGTLLADDYPILDAWATVTAEDNDDVTAMKRAAFCNAVLEVDRRYLIARQSLRQFYDAGLQMVESVTSFEGEQGAQVVAAQFIGAGKIQLIPGLAGDDEQVKEIATGIIDGLAAEVQNVVDGVTET